MSCTLFGPLPPLPDIFPLTLTPPTLPPISGDLTICCKLVQFVFVPILPVGPILINSAVMAVINAQIAIVNGFIRAMQLPCPKE